MPGVPVTHIDDADHPLFAGTHKGADGSAVLRDPGALFITCGADKDLSLLVKNTTDGSEGALTAATDDTVTCTLAGGTDNDWDNGDEYVILKTDTEDAVISRHYTDKLFGRKVTDPAELTEDGRFPEDDDLEDDEWSPGFPERDRF